MGTEESSSRAKNESVNRFSRTLFLSLSLETKQRAKARTNARFRSLLFSAKSFFCV